ncbi:MAG: DinB family protein [bacterium]|nr:DinB family protein [bacterium]
MYTTITQFLKDWKYESDSTIKMLNNLTEESLSQRITPDGRSLGFLAWHIAQTIPEMLGKTGLKLEGPAEDEKYPSSAKEIREGYEKASNSLMEQLPKSWKDETLNEENDMYGEKWMKGMTLMYLILHQAHHRGQMSVLMRQAGVIVPGVYGPAKEEWTAMGMEPFE